MVLDEGTDVVDEVGGMVPCEVQPRYLFHGDTQFLNVCDGS